jgi:Ser/Thr protein kinase RdoA (MazF antagonist)
MPDIILEIMCGRRVRLTPSLQSAYKLPRKRRSLDILKAYGPARPITGITLHILPFLLLLMIRQFVVLLIHVWVIPATAYTAENIYNFETHRENKRIFDVSYSGSEVEGTKYFRPL